MKIICNVCCNKQNVIKNTYCPICGNNISEQFFNEELKKSKEIVAHEKEKMQLINYCLQESEKSISKSIIATRYKYIKNKLNKDEYLKI